MPLLAVVARFNDKSKNKCKVKIAGGINLQKLRWVGYAVSLDGVDKQVQDSVSDATVGAVGAVSTGGQGNALGFQGHLIPNQLVVNLDILNTNQVHIANSAQTDADGNFIDNTNPYSNGLPLALSDSLNTIQMGMGDIQFEIGKTVRNEVEVEVLKYNDTGKLVPMPCGEPFLSDETNTITTIQTVGANNQTNNIYGSVALQSLILYFHYDFSAYF